MGSIAPRALVPWALALLALTAGLAPVTAGDTDTWTVSGEETIEGRPLVIARDVVVEPGGTLRLLGVDALVASAPHDPVSITVESGGTLVLADGTDPIDGSDRGTSLASPASTFDLVVQPGGTLVADNASLERVRAHFAGSVHLEDVQAGPWGGSMTVTDGETRVADSSLVRAPGTLVQLEGGVLEVSNSTLGSAGGHGIAVEAGELQLNDSRLHDLEWRGVYATGGSITLIGNDLSKASLYMIQATGADASLIGNRIHDTGCGVELRGDLHAEVRGNTIETDDHGLSVEGTDDLQATRNRIDGPHEGVMLEDSEANLSENAVRNASVGIQLDGSNANLSLNRIHENGVGIRVKVGDASDPRLRNNSFEANGEAALANEQSRSVDARWNWWGHPDGPNQPGGETVEGPVDVDPWREQPP